MIAAWSPSIRVPTTELSRPPVTASRRASTPALNQLRHHLEKASQIVKRDRPEITSCSGDETRQAKRVIWLKGPVNESESELRRYQSSRAS